jgi:hypothetical protein
MSRLTWLQNAGERYLERIKLEDPVFLVELEISSEYSGPRISDQAIS